MEIEWSDEMLGPWIEGGRKPEWYRNEQIQWMEGVGLTIRAHEWGDGEWSCVPRFRLPADHSYYLATSKGFTYWPGGESAPDDWDGGSILLDWGKGEIEDMDKVEHGSDINWGRDPDGAGSSFANVIGYHRKSDFGEAIVTPRSPQPTGSATITGLSVKIDATELKEAIAATSVYTVTRKIGEIEITITGPDLAHILRTIRAKEIEDGKSV